MAGLFEKNILSRNFRTRIVSLLTSLFAIIYHSIFLVVFKILKVDPMFYFNIVSVGIFLVTFFTILQTRSQLIPYTLSAIEVLVHQIFAEYFVGSATSFRFLILIIGFLPLLVFNNKNKLTVPFGIFCMALFSFMQISSIFNIPVYTIPEKAVSIIKFSNIFLSMILLFSMVALSTQLMTLFENQLEKKVSLQTEQLLQQSEKIIKIQNNTIISLSNLVENRDSDTGDHVQRTSEYVKLLAYQTKKAGYYSDILTDEYIETLTRAAPMHDIGKIIISDAILKKPGKLTAEEFDEIKKHTIEGRRIVYSVLENNDDKIYVETAAELATYHHEKWNGNGYPYKKSGENIPLGARIMAIADVFDALVSPRCYKKPIPVDDAFHIIMESSGEHFDPILVKCFIDIRPQIEEIVSHITY